MTPDKASLEEQLHPQDTVVTNAKHPRPEYPSTSPPKKRLNACTSHTIPHSQDSSLLNHKSNLTTVTHLMSPKPKPTPTPDDAPPPSTLQKLKNLDPRNGLGIYLTHPSTNPESRVISFDNDFVLIRDKFPKASVHLLLMPRREEFYFQHPLKLLSTDAAFLADVTRRVEEVKRLAARELARLFGGVSAQDKVYHNALDKLMSKTDTPTKEQLSALPQGRDWSRDIIAGVHTHPSMNHMHIHVFSRDMHSECMKHKKHYLSFNSSFLVRMEEFPLEEGSERFKPGDWPKWDMKCWRCGENYGNRFKRLKEHLEEEFGEWVKE